MSLLEQIPNAAKEVLGLIAKHAPDNIAPYAKELASVADILADGKVTEDEVIQFAKDSMTLASDETMKKELGL